VGSIGREIAKKIEKYFKAKVNPQTITTKAFRQKQTVSNETPQPTLQEDNEIQEKPSEEKRDEGGQFQEGIIF